MEIERGGAITKRTFLGEKKKKSNTMRSDTANDGIQAIAFGVQAQPSSTEKASAHKRAINIVTVGRNRYFDGRNGENRTMLRRHRSDNGSRTCRGVINSIIMRSDKRIHGIAVQLAFVIGKNNRDRIVEVHHVRPTGSRAVLSSFHIQMQFDDFFPRQGDGANEISGVDGEFTCKTKVRIQYTLDSCSDLPPTDSIFLNIDSS